MEVSDPRARLATLSSAWSWIPPCHVWSTFARRWNCLVVGVCASKVCTQRAFCTFRQALLCSASRYRALVCSGSSCFRRHPSQVINLSTDTIVPQLYPLRLHCVPRGQWALGTSSTASGRCSRKNPSLLCSPSCSSRAAHVALITKISRLTVLRTLSP